MPRIPLPSRELQAGASPALGAPGTLSMPDVVGEQTQRLGGAMTGAGLGLSAAARQVENDVAEAEADEAFGVYAELTRKDLEADGGFLTLKGKDAVEGAAAARKKLAARRREIEGGIKSPIGREVFAQRIRGVQGEAASRIDRHHANAVRAYKDAGLSARIDASIDGYRRTMQDPPAAEGAVPRELVHREIALRTVRELAEHRGASPEELQQLLLRTKTRMHAGVVDDLVAQGLAQQAKDYVTGLDSKEVEPDKLGDLQRLVREADVQDRSLQAAMFIQDKAPDFAGQRALLDEMYRGKHIDVEMRDATLRRLQADDDERHQQRVRLSNEVVDQAETWAKLNRGRPADEMPTHLRTALRDTGKEEQFKLFLEQGGQRVTSEKGWEALVRLTPARLRTFRTVDELVDAYRFEMRPDHLRQLVGDWHEAHNLPKPSGVPEGRANAMIRLALVDKGLLPKDRAPNRKETLRADRLELAIQRRAEDMAGPGGKADEKILDEAVKKELGNELWTQAGEKIPLGGMSPVERETGYVDTTPGIRVGRPGVVSDRDASVTMTREAEQELLQQHADENAERVLRGLAPKPEPTWPQLAERFAETYLPEMRRREAEAMKRRREATGLGLTGPQFVEWQLDQALKRGASKEQVEEIRKALRR